MNNVLVLIRMLLYDGYLPSEANVISKIHRTQIYDIRRNTTELYKYVLQCILRFVVQSSTSEEVSKDKATKVA